MYAHFSFPMFLCHKIQKEMILPFCYTSEGYWYQVSLIQTKLCLILDLGDDEVELALTSTRFLLSFFYFNSPNFLHCQVHPFFFFLQCSLLCLKLLNGYDNHDRKSPQWIDAIFSDRVLDLKKGDSQNFRTL